MRSSFTTDGRRHEAVRDTSVCMSTTLGPRGRVVFRENCKYTRRLSAISRTKHMPWKDFISDSLARFVSIVLPPRLMKQSRFFHLWENRGYHVTPVHFYQPIPDTRELGDCLWDLHSPLVGIDMNESQQIELLRRLASGFATEFECIPDDGNVRPPRNHAPHSCSCRDQSPKYAWPGFLVLRTVTLGDPRDQPVKKPGPVIPKTVPNREPRLSWFLGALMVDPSGLLTSHYVPSWSAR